MTRTIPHGALVVSCQAHGDNPLAGPDFMRAMALAAIQGGARGLRAEGVADIAAIRAVTDLPIIGLLKRDDPGYDVRITPDFDAAQAVLAAGADIVALDCTLRPRHGAPIAALLHRIRTELGVPIMADIATDAEAEAAIGWGVDYVGTTLAGYTAQTHTIPPGPDIGLVERIARRGTVRVIAEGRYDMPDQVAHAFAAGAHAVVIGTAITNPREITRRFVAATPR